MNELERDAAREADVDAKLRVIRAQLWVDVYKRSLVETVFLDVARSQANCAVLDFDKILEAAE